MRGRDAVVVGEAPLFAEQEPKKNVSCSWFLFQTSSRPSYETQSLTHSLRATAREERARKNFFSMILQNSGGGEDVRTGDKVS